MSSETARAATRTSNRFDESRIRSAIATQARMSMRSKVMHLLTI